MDGLLIPVIGYEVYHPLNNSQLNLSYCSNTTVKINIPVSIDEDKLYKYDPNSDFYNDDCYAYTTENGTDIILKDRKNEFKNNNLSLCENNCTFNEYDSDNKKALCECETKIKLHLISKIEAEENILSNNFTSSKNSTSGLDAMKCISLLFSKDGLLSNIGSYILLFTFLLFSATAIIFYKFGYRMLAITIEKIESSKNKENKSNDKIKIYNAKKNNNKKLNNKKINTKEKKIKKKGNNKAKSNPSKKKQIKN
jgi:cell division protein FtsL